MLVTLNNKLVKQLLKTSLLTLFASGLVLFSFSATIHADGGMPIQDTIVFEVPENLAKLTTEEISDLRQTHMQNLKRTAANDHEIEQAEERLFKQLMDHDLIRLSIADVIPMLIQDYQIEGEFKETLLNYKKTFEVNMMENRQVVENLEDYPSYDFRFAAAYMSMLYSFQKYPDFYERLKEDLVDQNTHIGNYRKTLDESYARVKQVRAETDFAKSGNDLKKVIAALDDELANRAK